jgi:hypothetical protein
MADDISIFVKVVGQKDIVATTNSLNKLEAGVKRLSNDLSKGRISSTQYTTGLRELRKSVDSSFGSWQKAKSAVDQYSKQVRQAQAIQKQAQAAIKAEAQALKEYRQARREATAENQRFDAEQRKAVRTAREAANANRRLRMEFREGYAAKVQLRAAQMRLSQAFRQGIIDSDQYEAQLQQLTTAQRNLGNAAMAGGRKMSGAGMAVQQVGYQAGDFLVQIQGGTNAFVAFGQQATQLVGVLPMVATQLGLTAKAAIGISAALGIIIPLTTAVAAAFMRTRQTVEALSLEDAYTAVADAANDAAKASGDFGNSARDGFIVAKTEALAFLEVLKGVRSEQLQVALDTALASTGISEAIRSFNEGVNFTFAAEAMSGVGRSVAEIEASLADANIALGLNITQAREFESILRTVGGTTKSEIVDSFFSAVQSLKDANLLTDETNKLITQMADSLGIVEDAYIDLSDAQSTLKEGAQGFLNIWTAITEQIKTAVDEAKKMPQTLSDNEFQQMLFYQAYGASREAAPDTPPAATGSTRTPSRGAAAKTPAELAAEAVAKLQEQLKVQRELVGATQAEAAVRKSLGDNFENVSPKIVQGLQEQYAEVQKLIEAENQRQSIIESVSGSVGDSLMSMVEGTKSVKDAFKSMARDIIAELYRVLVVQQIVNSAKTAMGGFFADGAAFSGGRVTPFANGGVVGSPTMFPMAGGKTGLMGEAGPEAIMPLKRGADGKLGVSVEGGSGSVTVNNNINVTGGTDPAAIRMEVAKLMPQITNATKTAVIDARRRGGQMKAAFS